MKRQDDGRALIDRRLCLGHLMNAREPVIFDVGQSPPPQSLCGYRVIPIRREVELGNERDRAKPVNAAVVTDVRDVSTCTGPRRLRHLGGDNAPIRERLSRLEVAKQGREQHVGFVALIRQRSKILYQMRRRGDLRQVESQDRAVILVGHSAKQRRAGHDVAGLRRCQPLRLGQTARGVELDLAGSRLQIKTCGLKCLDQDLGVYRCHGGTMHKHLLTRHCDYRGL